MSSAGIRYVALHARNTPSRHSLEYAQKWFDQLQIKSMIRRGASQCAKLAMLATGVAQVQMGLLSVDLNESRFLTDLGLDLRKKEGAVEDNGIGAGAEGQKPVNGVEKKQFLKLVSGAAVLPHPNKVEKGGEDAYFIANNSMSVGVADGVGGWAEMGIDPGLYSKQLMHHAKQLAEEEELSPHSAQTILERSHKFTQVMGSSTACILVLHANTLYASNVGDSGFMIIRDKQLGGEGAMGDTPEKSQKFELQVQQGDVIVSATDGVMDNVYTEDTATIVSTAKKQGLGPQETAERLATFAQDRGMDSQYLSPFAREAQKIGYQYLGGKLDDVTVVVSYVQRQSSL